MTQFNNKEQLLESLVWSLAQCPGNSLIFLAHYGSRKQASDLDLFAVFQDRVFMSQVNFGNVDLLQLRWDEFVVLLNGRDICVTEPVLTGELLVGDVSEWSRLGARLGSEAVPAKAVEHLLDSARAALANAKKFYQFASQENSRTNCAGFWSNYSFAVGYFEFALHYSRGGRVIACSDLATTSQPLAEAIAEARLQRREWEQSSPERMKDMVDEFELRIEEFDAQA